MYKVLIADDETLDLEGMKAFIPWESLGMEIVGAVTNGFSACELAERERVDVLVTDVNMPNMSGLELARRVRERYADVRVVFVSGYRDFQYVKEALALQAYSYVLKPMNEEELIESLDRIRKDLDEARERERELKLMRSGGMQHAERSDIAAEGVGGQALERTWLSGKPVKNGKLIQEVIDYMREGLERQLTLKEAADKFGFSPNYLGQLFKEASGRSFHECLVALRMERAGELLRDPKLRIYEVAGRVGYRYMPYFSKQFKETYGMTPVEFRNGDNKKS
ncbi:Helix-turn-helix domain-containing protein [Paenibacillus sp. UNCCL117]|uniref:response regulator transcription factor n=1 Tax=unclassified Paenibacillus TaxID=185978 RepID=UPI00088044A5|nr:MULTISPECIES: response regulator [unclassified Paenibacillus]SDD18231.1 Helix-turn-helix domain-containing protein [Paenibacillus sp. cl123]SFW35171.1 Helix-turn-helix domain-containing protein [Paenibacillus sp. UNCCL117]